MKRLIVVICALTLFVPALALAQSVFNGTWKLDPSSVQQYGGKALVISLKNGVFKRSNAASVIQVKADGKDQPISGHSGFNSVAIDVINGHSYKEVDKKDGKVVTTVLFTAAADGKTATVVVFLGHGANHSTAKELMKRVAKGAPGSNAVSGSWRLDRALDTSGNMFDLVYKVSGNTVTSLTRDDIYTATLGGKPVPRMVNGKAEGTVSVKMLSKNTLRETHYNKHGKESVTSTMTILRGGKAMMMVIHNVKTGATEPMIHYKVISTPNF